MFRAFVPDLAKMVDVFAVNPMNQTVYLSHVQLFGTEGDDVLMKYGHEPEQVKLMQGTGLNDKNGTAIFEGDVVRLKFRDGHDAYSFELGVIRWHEYSSAFKWFAVDEDPSDGNNYWLTHADSDWREIVGNIHDRLKLEVAS